MARREARELADMRAMKIQSRRSNPVGGSSDRQAVMIPMVGGSATPSMGLSQFRGGRRGSSSSSGSGGDGIGEGYGSRICKYSSFSCSSGCGGGGTSSSSISS